MISQNRLLEQNRTQVYQYDWEEICMKLAGVPHVQVVTMLTRETQGPTNFTIT